MYFAFAENTTSQSMTSPRGGPANRTAVLLFATITLIVISVLKFDLEFDRNFLSALDQTSMAIEPATLELEFDSNGNLAMDWGGRKRSPHPDMVGDLRPSVFNGKANRYDKADSRGNEFDGDRGKLKGNEAYPVDGENLNGNKVNPNGNDATFKDEEALIDGDDGDKQFLPTGSSEIILDKKTVIMDDLRKIIFPSMNSERLVDVVGNKKMMCEDLTLVKDQKLNSGIHLIMSFFKGTYRIDRFDEIVQTLKRNLKNPYMTAVHALWEDVDPIEFVLEAELRVKLVRVNFGTQPRYKDMFDYANVRLGRGAVGIVANTDIAFDTSLKCVSPVPKDRSAFNATKEHLVYALSRHPSASCPNRPDFCQDYTGSHDAFIFAAPLPAKFSVKLDFKQNNLGAENVVIWEFKRAKGYVVRNPCGVVRIVHMHCTRDSRHYSEERGISRGRFRVGPFDRHADAVPSSIKCGQVLY